MLIRLNNKIIIILALIFTMLIASACSENVSDELRDQKSSFQAGNYRIEFDMPGDDFASVGDLDIIKNIQAKIVEIDAGKIISTGSGMGTMAITVQIEKKDSIELIKKIIQDIFPGSKYIIIFDKNPALGQ